MCKCVLCSFEVAFAMNVIINLNIYFTLLYTLFCAKNGIVKNGGALTAEPKRPASNTDSVSTVFRTIKI